MITSGIDHVLVAVPDIEAARAEFEALGFQVTPGARHERFGTHNRLCVLGSTYLELIAIRDHEPADRSSIGVLGPCIARGGGVPMLALATSDAARSHQLLAARGVDVEQPVSWSRPADTPDGLRTAAFTTLFSRSELLPELVAFFCQHHTPQFVRCPAWQRHPNGATDVIGVEIPTPQSPEALLATLRTRIGDEAVPPVTEILSVRLGNHTLAYRHSTDATTRQITIAVESLPKAAMILGKRGERTGAQALSVKLGCARDTELLFVENTKEP